MWFCTADYQLGQALTNGSVCTSICSAPSASDGGAVAAKGKMDHLFGRSLNQGKEQHQRIQNGNLEFNSYGINHTLRLP